MVLWCVVWGELRIVTNNFKSLSSLKQVALHNYFSLVSQMSFQQLILIWLCVVWQLLPVTQHVSIPFLILRSNQLLLTTNNNFVLFSAHDSEVIEYFLLYFVLLLFVFSPLFVSGQSSCCFVLVAYYLNKDRISQ